MKSLIEDHAAERADLYTRLHWKYGPERAGMIMDGRDRQTNEDLKRWRRLGDRK